MDEPVGEQRGEPDKEQRQRYAAYYAA